ncbi:MAG: hypothetical protein Q9187_002518 [Circinaria calcarea]
MIAMPIDKVDYDINTFFPLFSKYIYQLCNTEYRIAESTISVLRDFEADGVVYLELRTTPRASSGSSGSGGFSKDHYVAVILNAIHDFDRFAMSVYLILSIDRSNTASEAMAVVDLAIKYQSQGVLGIDLCGNPLKGDVSTYREAFAKARCHGLRVTLHFAEVPASSTGEELQTLLSFKPDRLGHVINVPDTIKNEIIDRRLGLELCLTCNVNAKLISGGFAAHHFSYWRNKGCPIVLCTDDVGIFGSTLSNEYLLAAKHFNLSRKELLDLCKSGIDSVFGSEDDKTKLRGVMKKIEDEL